MKKHSTPITVRRVGKYRIEEYLKDRQADSFYRIFSSKDERQVATIYDKKLLEQFAQPEEKNTKKIFVEFEVDEDVTADALHEALCRTIYDDDPNASEDLFEWVLDVKEWEFDVKVSE